MNNGSLTQNLNSLLINRIKIEMSQKYKLNFKDKLNNIRIVWLENDLNQNLTFARSIWIINKKNNLYKNILNTNPIGYSLIKYQIDIYRELQEISCGYCYNLENKYQKSQLIWARKYKIFYPNNSYVIIEEYFKPKLIEFFN